MVNKFLTFINDNKLFNSNDKILIGISGGIDSVVLLDLFSKANLIFSIAHCNFNLRGEESDNDETLVKNLAKKYQVENYTESFNTIEYSKENNISIEMAARDLRYNWFNSLLEEKGYNKIAVAHHKNDSAETLFLNLIRGTGISGLHGILPINNKIVRPLLFASREEIEGYAKSNNLEFNTDSSNSSSEYQRNKIRNEVFPILKDINPSIINTLTDNISRFSDAEKIFFDKINEEKKKILSKNGSVYELDIIKLLKLNPLKTYLFEFIKEFGFTSANVEDILSVIDKESGKKFFSSSHQLIKDREKLIISKLKDTHKKEYYINNESISVPIKIDFSIHNSNKIKILKNKNIAYLDINKLKFPLKLRKWKNGDFFVPFGLGKKKKLSDFFIDNKFSLIEKEDTWILESDGKIVWIIGYRTDDRFKINSKSTRILQLTYINI